MSSILSPRGTQRRGGLPVVFEMQLAATPSGEAETKTIAAPGARNNESGVSASSFSPPRAQHGDLLFQFVIVSHAAIPLLAERRAGR